MSAMSCTSPATASSGSSGCEPRRFAPHCSAWKRPSISGSSYTPAPRAEQREELVDGSRARHRPIRGALSARELGFDVGDEALQVQRAGRRSAGCAAPPATATRSARIRSARAAWSTARRVVGGDSVGRVHLDLGPAVAVAAVQHIDTLLVAPDACVQMAETQPSGSPAACDRDDLAERGLDQVEHVRADVEHRAPLEPPAVRERSAEERARDEARPAADRARCRVASARKSARRGVEAVGEHHERRRRRSRATASTTACAPRDVGAEGLFEQQRLARPGRRGSRARAALPGVTAIATASHASKSASRSAKAGTCSVSPSSGACAGSARPDAGDAGLRARRRASGR